MIEGTNSREIKGELAHMVCGQAHNQSVVSTFYISCTCENWFVLICDIIMHAVCPKLSDPAYGEVTVAYDVATYSCQYGYKLKGDKKRTCSYGVWSGSQPRCEKCKNHLTHVVVNCITYCCVAIYSVSQA